MSLRHLKVWALVALLALAAPQLARAAATVAVSVPNSGWTLLGAGPIQITPNGAITYAISDTTPVIPITGGFKIAANSTVTISTQSNVYAVATGSPVVTIYVAPVIAPGAASLTWPGTAALTNYGVAPTGTVPGINAFVTNPATFTWPGTAALTNFGVPPTGTVPAVNAAITEPSNVTVGSCSTTIASGGVAQNLPNLGTASVHGFHIVNKDFTAGGGEPIGVNPIAAAALTGSADTGILPPPTDALGHGAGSFSTSPGEGTNHAISVVAGSAGHVIMCWWW